MSDNSANDMARPLPVSIEEIDCDWLTRALRIKVPGVTVRNFEIVDMIRGTCTKIRLRLDMDEAGRQAGIPETVFLKGGFESHSRDLVFLLMSESLGYRDLLPNSGLNNPACYFADYDEARQQGIVIMEDLANRSVTFGDPLRPRGYDDIAQTLSLLAGYHARTWGCAAFGAGDRLSWIDSSLPFTRPSLKRLLAPDVWQRYVAMPRGAAASVRFHDLGWAIGALQSMEALTGEVPNCVIHGDTHLGNVFFEPGGAAGFYDIVPRRAAPMSEVCYHITLALDVADRSRWEEALVRHYLAELAAHGIADAPGFDEAMRQYAAFLVEGYCLVLLNDAYFMPEALITAYAARFSAAMLDHDTAGLHARATDSRKVQVQANNNKEKGE